MKTHGTRNTDPTVEIISRRKQHLDIPYSDPKTKGKIEKASRKTKYILNSQKQ